MVLPAIGLSGAKPTLKKQLKSPGSLFGQRNTFLLLQMPG
jgi:hypothetical protein